MNKLFFLPLAIALISCSGGGSSSNPESDDPQSPTDGTGEQEPVVEIVSEPTEITRNNTPALASVVVDLLRAGRDVHGTWSQGRYFDDLDSGEHKGSCDVSGSYRTKLASDKTRLEEHYDNCHMFDEYSQQDLTISGDMETHFSGVDSDGSFQVKIIYRDYSVNDDSGVGETLNGIIRYEGNRNEDVADLPEISLDLHAVNDVEGEFNAVDFRYVIAESLDFMNQLEGAIDVNGLLEYQPFGTAQVSFSNGTIVLSGRGDNLGRIQLAREAAAIHFNAGGNNSWEYGLSVPIREMEGIPFGASAPSTPYLRLTNVYGLNAHAGQPLQFSVLPNFMDAGGHLLEVVLEVQSITLQDSAYDPLAKPTDELPFSYTIEQPQAGLFTITTTDEFNTDVAVFGVEVSAINTIGNSNEEPLPLKIYIYRDTDGDGIADVDDEDDDNDGEPDHSDMLPKDPSETMDMDQDGVGDNADLDDDNDGTEDTADFYPNDSLCYAQTDGDGERCWFHSLTRGDWDRTLDRNGVIYYSQQGNLEIKRWDSTTEHFLPSIQLDPSSTGSTGDNVALYYAEPQHVLYIEYSDLVISRINLDAEPLLETLFVRASAEEESAAFFGTYPDFSGNFTVIRTQARYGQLMRFSYYSYNLSGELVEYLYEEHELSNYDLDYRSVKAAPFCISGFRLETETGRFVEIGSGDEGSDLCDDDSTPLVSPDGERAIFSFSVFASNSIVTTNQEVVDGSKPIQFEGRYFGWTRAGIYDLDYVEETLYHYDDNGDLMESTSLEPNQYPEDFLSNKNHLIWYDGEAPQVFELPGAAIE